jgi:AcrR family transcriptional regulator
MIDLQGTLLCEDGGAQFGTADYSGVTPSNTQRQILDAAIEVLAENEFENFTMDKIAAHAGVSRLKLYRQFGNRTALIEAVIAYRLMQFDLRFFSTLDRKISVGHLVERYLSASVDASRNNPVSRRWASGGMKFIYVGSLIHLTAVATWSPVFEHSLSDRYAGNEPSVESMALWLIMLQYSLSRLTVETDIDETSTKKLVEQFVSPAFR